MKNFFFKFITYFARIFFKKNKVDLSNLKILVLSTTGLGDTLWATPAIREIKKKYPNCLLSVLTTKLGKEILLENPNINQLYILEKFFSFSLIRLWKILKNQKFQMVFQFHSSQRYALPFVSSIGAEKIVGTLGLCKKLDTLLTDNFAKIEEEHEIDRRLKMLKTIHIQAKRSSPDFFFNEEDTKWAKDNYPKSKLSIAMHPKAKDEYKCWPISFFIKLGMLLEEKFDCKIYVTGTNSEKSWLEKIVKNLHNAESICALPVRKFASFLSQMDFLISNDTGPMHLGSALNIKTVSIFSSTDPKHCGPVSNYSTVIYKPKTCTPCLKRRCAQPFCFYQISPKMVFDEFNALFLNDH